MPLIAVTTSEIRASGDVKATPQGEPPQHEMALGLKYLQAIEAAGGIPVVVPPLHIDAARRAPRPSRRGLPVRGARTSTLTATASADTIVPGRLRADLDEFELEFARAADARRLPILAICRGLQVLNVARGGTLHQHLPEVVGDRINHRQTRARAAADPLGRARAREPD